MSRLNIKVCISNICSYTRTTGVVSLCVLMPEFVFTCVFRVAQKKSCRETEPSSNCINAFSLFCSLLCYVSTCINCTVAYCILVRFFFHLLAVGSAIVAVLVQTSALQLHTASEPKGGRYYYIGPTAAAMTFKEKEVFIFSWVYLLA